MTHTQTFAWRSLLLFGLSASCAAEGGGTEVEEPAIEVSAFTALPASVSEFGEVVFSWTTSGAERVELYDGEEEIYSTDRDVESGTFTTDAGDRAAHTYALVARSGDASVKKTITVEVAARGRINFFQIAPAVLIGGDRALTLSWHARGDTFVLTANGAPVPEFSGAATGTIALELAQNTRFQLTAIGAGGGARDGERRTLAAVFGGPETEPNDEPGSAEPINGGVRGKIEPAGDLDLYTFEVPEGSNVFISTSDERGGCALDTVITLYDENGERLAQNDDRAPWVRCSELDPANNFNARDLRGGTYYVSVESYQKESSGDYALVVWIGAAECGNGFPEPSNGEQCDDGARAAGDGCDASCRFETRGTISGEGGSISVLADSNGSAPALIEVVIDQPGQWISAVTHSALGECLQPMVLALFDSNTRFLGAVEGEDGCVSLEPMFMRDARFAADLPPDRYLLAVVVEGAPEMITVDITLGTAACGDRILERSIDEQCDDGNLSSGDGCSERCAIELRGEVAGLDQTQIFEGTFAAGSPPDFYGVTLPEPGYLYAETGAPEVGTCLDGADTVLLVASAHSEEPLAVDDDLDRASGNRCSRLDPIRSRYGLLPPGDYLIAIFSSDGVELPRYQLRIETRRFVAPIPEIEPNDDFASADAIGPIETPLGENVALEGSIAAFDRDLFSFVVPEDGATLLAKTHPLFGDPTSCGSIADSRLSLYDASGALLIENDDLDAGAGELCSLIDGTVSAAAAKLSSGTYYLAIEHHEGGQTIGSYFIDLRLWR